MTRALTIRQPTMAECFQLQSVIEYSDDARIRRRAEALLLYADGLNAVEIAQALQAHVNTIYLDLQAFEHDGLHCLKPSARGGAPARITLQPQSVIWRLAEREPLEFGLPYGRWSLANFREFLIKQQRVLKRISREQLRQILKKSRFVFSVSSAN
jgi:transposase